MKLKRILAAVLALMTLLLAACNSNQNEDTDTAEPAVTIGASELSEYTVVVREDVSVEEKTAVTDLVKKIYEKFGTMLKIVDDAISKSDKEILVGDVNREETKSARADMKYDDYFLGIVDEKLLVVGGSESATAAAIQKLCEVVDANADSDIFFDNGVDMQNYKHSYTHEDIKINGTSVSEYTIMYADKGSRREATMAQALQKAIISVCGVEVTAQPDTKDAYGSIIYLGGSATAATLRIEGDVIYVTGANENDVFFATQTLIERVCESTDGSVTVGAEETLSYNLSDLDLSKWGVSSEKIKVMSYNLQNAGNGSTSMTKYRNLASMIDSKSPDFVAVQECITSGSGAENLVSAMANKTKYAAVTTTGITTAVIYNKNKYTFIEKGVEAIGKKDDKYGSAYDRNMMWTKFRSNATGAEFIVLSVHIDYVKAANAAQLKLIMDYMQTNFAGIPAVLLGDYNAEEKVLDVGSMEKAGYVDCRKTATVAVNATVPTFPSDNSIIDYIFAKGMTSEYYETLTSENNPSDHRPIYAELYIG